MGIGGCGRGRGGKVEVVVAVWLRVWWRCCGVEVGVGGCDVRGGKNTKVLGRKSLEGQSQLYL